MTQRTRILLILCATLLPTFALSIAWAHDFVLWPTPARLNSPGLLTLNLWVGDHMAFEEQRPYQVDRVAHFEHTSAQGTLDLSKGQTTKEKPSFATLDLKTKGGHWVRLDRPAVDIELEAQRFNHYLEHERLLHILAERTRLGESNLPGKERYTRHLKTFLQVGEVSDKQGCTPMGQAFEIVPLQDPALLKQGATLKVELRAEGKPIGAQPVEAMTRVGGDVVRVPLLSDASGQATVTFSHPGQWVLRRRHDAPLQGVRQGPVAQPLDCVRAGRVARSLGGSTTCVSQKTCPKASGSTIISCS